jgi:hypothetical protein
MPSELQNPSCNHCHPLTSYIKGQWLTERGGRGGGFKFCLPPKFRSFDKAEPNFQFHGKYIRNNLIRIRGSLICKLSGTPDKGLPAPDPRSLWPLFSIEFVAPPPSPEKFLGTPLSRGTFSEVAYTDLSVYCMLEFLNEVFGSSV